MKLFLNLILFLLVFIASVFAQDTTRSQAFKDNQPRRPSYFKAKYPSYSLLAGYLLVTEANRGDPFAQHELGVRYLIGQGFPNDTVKAIYWISKAADQNLPSARFNYGILLHNGIGVPWNPFEAYINFKNAANAGMPEAQFAFGLLLTDNLVANRNYGEAYKLFQKSAKAGNEQAKEVLEQMKKSGFVPPADSAQQQNQQTNYDETAQIINPGWDLDFYDFENTGNKENVEENPLEILNKKSSELKKYLGLSGNQEIKTNDTSGVGILKYAADNGSPEALYTLARCYENGVLFEKNPVTAAANYLKAYRLGSYKAGENLLNMLQQDNFFERLKNFVNNNNSEAMYVFAGITALGFTNQISEQQALELFVKSAVQNHIPSIIELGLCYSSGTLVAKDIPKAIEYWNAAVNLGSKEAQLRIAFTRIADSTSRSDINYNVEILEKAADEGSVLAQTFLGFCYEKGLGVAENKSIASRLYRQAAVRGNQTAFNSLKRMYDELRPLDDEFKIYEAE